MDLEQVFIDETGCFLSTLNKSKNQIDIYIFEWLYHVKEPITATKVEKSEEEIAREREIELEFERQ